MSTQPIPIDEFAKRLRTKYPGAYDSLSDTQLVQKVMNKYPEYKEHVASFAPTDFEKQNVPPTAMERINSAAGKALSAAGLPKSINDIPNWFQHFTGTAPDSKPFYQPIVDAIHNPTQRNVVGAVPFIGPSSVSMSDDVRAGDYDQALGTLAGTIGGVAAGQQIKPGLQAAKAEAIDALRTPEGKLTPAAKLGARAVGVGVVGAAGHAVGIPEAGIAGAIYGPSIADAILPDRPPTPDFHGGAYNEFAGESGKAVPLSRSPYPENVAKINAARRATVAGQNPYAPPETAEAARQAGATVPDVIIAPEPKALFPGQNENYAASIPRSELEPLAQARQPGAAKQLQQLGKTVLFTPPGAGIETPSMAALRESLGIAESVPQGNPTPYSPPATAPEATDSAFSPWFKPRRTPVLQ